MTRAELESKHLAELHTLAEEAGVSGYRLLPRDQLIDKLSTGGSQPKAGGRREPAQRRPREERPRQRRETRKPRAPRADARKPSSSRTEQRKPSTPQAEPAAAPEPRIAPPTTPAPARPKRRRRRRFRRRKGIRVHDLLLPPVAGRQAIVYGETREGCTGLLREVAAELAGEKGPDPIALLIDPSPEELADWKREAPAAEIVAAGQERHADDALAQAGRRAEEGEDVILLIDSLTRLAEGFGNPDSAKELLDAGLSAGRSGSGSLTVVAALERQQ